MGEAGHVRAAFALGDRVQIPLTRIQGEHELDDSGVRLTAHLEPGVGDDPQHRMVLRQDVGAERPDALRAGQRPQVLHQ